MASRTIPARLNRFNIYRTTTGFSRPMGVATVTLPNLEAMSDTLTGAGILGEIDMPTLGQFGSTEIELEWNTITSDAVALAPGVAEELTFRGEMQVVDGVTGGIKMVGCRVVVKTVGKGLDLGSAEMGSATGTTNTLECFYIKIVVDGKETFELDKLNGVYRVNGVSLIDNKLI